MGLLKEVFLSREGLIASALIIVGILVASLAGKLVSDFKVVDIVVIVGSIIAMIGTQQLSQCIIITRNRHQNDDEEE